jgi:NADPH2:quinone reductase
VTGINVGDRVIYADGPLGAYATVRLYPAGQLVRIPDAISDVQAAASFLHGVTARMLLKETLPLHPGDTLFHAAAGGVGLEAVGLVPLESPMRTRRAGHSFQANCRLT